MTVTEPELPVPGLVVPVPVPFAPVWIASALRAGTVPLNDPLATVNLYMFGGTVSVKSSY